MAPPPTEGFHDEEDRQGAEGAREIEPESEEPVSPRNEQPLSPRGLLLQERKKFAMLSDRLARQRHGEVESDDDGTEDGEEAEVRWTSLPHSCYGSNRGMRFTSSEDAIRREKEELAARSALTVKQGATTASESKSTLPPYAASASTSACCAAGREILDKDTSGTGKHCRICFEGEEEKGEPLLSNLCACSGTMAHLHKSCLKQWIAESKTLVCEICKRSFRLSQSELDEWHAHFAQSRSQRSSFAVQAQAEESEEAQFEHVENPRLRSCLRRLWRNRGAMNSSIIVLVGTSILVMMSLVLYHFLSPTRENVIAGALPPGQNVYEPLNCTHQIEENTDTEVKTHMHTRAHTHTKLMHPLLYRNAPFLSLPRSRASSRSLLRSLLL